MTSYNVTHEQLERMYTRYRFASEFCVGKDVLEVACGTGQGLGYLARQARSVTAGDLDERMVSHARDHYKDSIEVRQFDAHNLPFGDGSFDVVILYEAIYYLAHPEGFIEEACRVLRDGGILIIGTVNKDWPGFNPSPYSNRYFSANELYALLKRKSFEVKLFADCPANTDGFKGRLIGAIKKTAVRLHLIPKTMKGKEKLKRLFFGKLIPLPPEITDDLGVAYSPPVSISHDSPNIPYKVLFAVGHIL